MKHGSRWFCAVVFSLWFTGCANAAETGDDLQQRLLQISRSFSLEESGKINFTEERQSKILSKPVTFSGYLTFDPNSGNMSRIITKPEASTTTIEKNHVVIEKDGKARRLSLRLRPGLRAFVALFASLRTGDVGELRKHFVLDYAQDQSGNNETWKLALTPEQKKLAKRVKNILIQGQSDFIESITTTLQNGDVQIMRFSE